MTTTFAADKVLRDNAGHSALLGADVGGYEIRHGRPVAHGGAALIQTRSGEREGCAHGGVLGTSWHGLLEHDEARRALLRWVADARGNGFVPAPGTCFAAERERALDTLADLIEAHLDTARLLELIDGGTPDGAARPAPRPRHRHHGACRVIRFITTADTEILATAGAVQALPDDFPAVRCANPKGTREIDPFLDEVLGDDARVVVIRVLGGRRGWQGVRRPLAERCRREMDRAHRARRRARARCRR